MSLAVAAFTLSSCNNEKKDQDFDNIVENGFYVVGEAGGYTDLNVLCQFAPGRNEADDNKLRDGMYEKYIVLEAGKSFYFAKKEGELIVNYGAQLQEAMLPTDAQEVPGYKGSLAENIQMSVKETGLYHIVLDFDQDEKLKNVGGAQIVIAKVDHWGIGGSINGWGYAQCDKAENYVYTWENFEFTEGAEFKFKNLGAWKLNLDDAELVKANTNIGKDGVPGGDNIKVEEGGLYTVTLTYKLAKGDIGESFAYTLTKTGEVAFKDYSAVNLELVGDAVADQEGASKCPEDAWNWGNVLPLGTPTQTGDVFTWTKVGVKLLAAGGFKVRTINAQPQGDIDAFDCGIDGGNATVAADGDYTIIFTVNGKTGAMNLQIIEGAEQGITVTGVVPAGWEKCYLWAWTADGDVFAAWPGQQLEIKDGKASYTFLPTVKSVSVIFSNGDGAQTNNIENITADQEIDIQANLK